LFSYQVNKHGQNPVNLREEVKTLAPAEVHLRIGN